jgi:hypothetical protein
MEMKSGFAAVLFGFALLGSAGNVQAITCSTGVTFDWDTEPDGCLVGSGNPDTGGGPTQDPTVSASWNVNGYFGEDWVGGVRLDSDEGSTKTVFGYDFSLDGLGSHPWTGSITLDESFLNAIEELMVTLKGGGTHYAFEWIDPTTWACTDGTCTNTFEADAPIGNGRFGSGLSNAVVYWTGVVPVPEPTALGLLGVGLLGIGIATMRSRRTG